MIHVRSTGLERVPGDGRERCLVEGDHVRPRGVFEREHRGGAELNGRDNLVRAPSHAGERRRRIRCVEIAVGVHGDVLDAKGAKSPNCVSELRRTPQRRRRMTQIVDERRHVAAATVDEGVSMLQRAIHVARRNGGFVRLKRELEERARRPVPEPRVSTAVVRFGLSLDYREPDWRRVAFGEHEPGQRERHRQADRRWVANRPLQWRGEHGDPKQVLRVGERARIGEEHRRVSEPAQANEQPIRVPGQDPRVEQRAARTVRERLTEMADQRIRGDEGGRRKRECDCRSFASRRRVEALPETGESGACRQSGS